MGQLGFYNAMMHLKDAGGVTYNDPEQRDPVPRCLLSPQDCAAYTL